MHVKSKNTSLIISRAIICAILLLLSIVILRDANWIFDMSLGDDYQLVGTTAVGKNAHSYTGNGRFWPLGLCDYCILLLLPYGTTVTAHFLYNCVTMILASVMLFSFLNKITADYSKINKDSVVILSEETYSSSDFKKISEHLNASKLTLSQSFQDMKTMVFRAN